MPKFTNFKKRSLLEYFQYGLLLFVILIPFADHSRMSILYNKILPVRVLLLLLFISGLVVFGQGLFHHRIQIKKVAREIYQDNILRALGALWLIRLVSIMQSHNLSASLELFAFYSAMIGLYVLMKSVILPSRFFVVKLVRTYVFVGLIIGFYGLFQYFYFKLSGKTLPGVLVGGDYIRLPATFFDANHFAAYLATVAPMVVAIAWLAKSFWAKVFWWACYFFVSFVILYSFSRSGLLSLLVSSAVILAIGVRSGYYRKIMPLLTALALGGLVIFISNATGRSLFDRAQSIFDLNEPSTKAHYLLLRGEVELFLENPIFGIGYGAFSEKFRQSEIGKEHSRVDPADVRIPAHSVWFEVITETGLVGLVAYLSFVGIVIRSLVKIIRSSKNKTVRIYASGFLSGLLGVWTGGLFYSYNLEFFWFFIFLAYLFTVTLQKLLAEGVVNADGEKRETLNWVEILPGAVVILISSVVILFRLGDSSLISSEALPATAAREMYNNSNWFVPTVGRVPYFGHSPLFYWLATHLVHLYAFTPTLIIRLLPALFGIGSVFVTYLVGRKMLGRYWGLLTAVSLLYLGPYIYLTRSVNTEIIASFFLMVAFLLLFYLRKYPYLILGVALALGAAFLTDGILALIFFIPFVAYLTVTKNEIIKKKGLINVAFGILMVLVLPWHLYALVFDTSSFLTNYFRIPNLLVFLPYLMLFLYYLTALYFGKLKLKFTASKDLRLALPVILVLGLIIYINLPLVQSKISVPDDNHDLVELVRSPEYIERAQVGLLLNGVSRKVVGYYSDYKVTEVSNYDIERAIDKEKQVLLITSRDRAEILLRKFAREERGLRRLRTSGMLDLLANY